MSNTQCYGGSPRRSAAAGKIEGSGMSNWASYGRVDADGTVWVKTAAGERTVGSWQAGTPEEGLAHFVRRRVVTGPERDGVLEVREGLRAGDRIATTGTFLLKSTFLEEHQTE